MILMIDNYDSFTYNLVQYMGELGAEIKVFRADKISLNGIKKLKPEKIVISPGPCSPAQAGISIQVAKEFAGKVPILGVCLGHQSIAVAFGGKTSKANKIMHGKISEVKHDGKNLFRGLPDPFVATRYHSLIIRDEDLPDCLEVTARTTEDEIMGIRHRDFFVEGVQFHPESILTKSGKNLLKNFLEMPFTQF